MSIVMELSRREHNIVKSADYCVFNVDGIYACLHEINRHRFAHGRGPVLFNYNVSEKASISASFIATAIDLEMYEYVVSYNGENTYIIENWNKDWDSACATIVGTW